jgi:SPX domain protein involved in polyphosphate accumulation
MNYFNNYTQLKTNRYERKFVNDYLGYHGTEQAIKMNSACFKEIFKPRVINNIYFDTSVFSFYYDNLLGKAERKKVRIRWYGEDEKYIEFPILEIKIKSGLTGQKKSYPLKPFNLDYSLSSEILKEVFKKSELPDDVLNEVLSLGPTLINRYKRKYFLDFSKQFRLTLDTDISYININQRNNHYRNIKKDERHCIVELKYDVENEIKVSPITNSFPFRITKNSKYVNGIETFKNIAI